MITDPTYHIQRLASLRTDRTQFDTQWQEAAERVDPAAKFMFLARGMNFNPGAKNTETMYDATAALAKQRFAAVIESLSTPQGTTWHRLVPVNKKLKTNRRIRMYFDEITALLFAMRYRAAANFVGSSQQVYQSIGGYGNGTLYIDRPEDKPGLRYRACHLSETYYAENSNGVVDTIYRTMHLTPRQAMEQFGADTPESVQSLAKLAASSDNNQSKREFLHVVGPRIDYDTRRVDVGGMPIASCYIFPQENKLLREGGFRSFPYAITRYTQSAGEVYGRGPAQWVLPSIKLLNAEKETFIKQGHRSIEPTLLAFDDGVMSGVNARPGAVNWGGISAEGKRLIDILPGGNIQLNEKMMELERNIINDAFLITLFEILTENPQMTATQVLERTREKGILIAPTAGRMQAEFLGPMIERELDLLQQQMLLPEPPPELVDAGGGYEIEYDSPMSRMQRAEKASGFNRSVNRAAEYAKMTNDPTPLDWFNFDTAMPELLDIDGAPAAWIATPEAVAQKRQQRAQQAQQQQMVDAAPALAAVAKTGVAQGQSQGKPVGES